MVPVFWFVSTARASGQPPMARLLISRECAFGMSMKRPRFNAYCRGALNLIEIQANVRASMMGTSECRHQNKSTESLAVT